MENSKYYIDNTGKIRTFFKSIRYGDYLDISTYSSGIVLKSSTTPKGFRHKYLDPDGIRFLEYQKRKVRRVQEKIIQLIECNFTRKSVFVTLTYAESDVDITNLKITNFHFEKFIVSIREYFPNIKYICVPEFQLRGAVHYHILFSEPFIDSDILKDCWKYGRSHVEKVYFKRGMAFYFVKYINKQHFDPRFFGKRTMFCSTKLVKPTVTYGVSESDKLDYFRDQGIKPVSTSVYSNDHLGIVIRKKFFSPLHDKIL